MFEIEKTFTIAIAHKLNLDYESLCRRFHGHSVRITICCRSIDVNKNGMVIDFMEIKRLIHDRLDHRCLNDELDFNPTAENLAEWICMQIHKCYQVDVQESEGNVARYIDDSFITE